jgi:hypothetical protein
MGYQQVQNQPTAAYILSMIGGILGLIGGLFIIIVGAIAGVFTFGLGFVAIGGIGIWITICSTIVIVAASKLKSEPMEHSKWGAIILVFSIIGGWSILDFIGGILELVYQPIPVGQAPYTYGATQAQPYGQQPQYYQQQPPTQQGAPQTITRICPNCGRVIAENVKFCPHCGKQLG